MSFTTPTVDVYVPGTTLGIGNVNAGTINIGKAGTTINVGGSMAVTNSVTTPSCTMTSLTTGNLIISPFSGDVAFNNFSARNATIGNASIMNASFNSINSSNILIGPYPVSGVFSNMNVSNATITTAAISNLSSTNINVLNASMTYVNVSGLLIVPLPTNPVFSGINTGSDTTTLSIGNNTNSIALNGQTTLAKPLILGTLPTLDTQLGGIVTGTILTTLFTGSPQTITSITLKPGTYIVSFNLLITYTGAPTSLYFSFNAAVYGGTSVNTINTGMSGSTVISSSSGATYPLTANYSGGTALQCNSTPSGNCYMYAVRVA